MSLGRALKRALRRMGVLPDVRREPVDPLREKRRLARIRAENARDAGDWSAAARHYAESLEGDDLDASNRIQYAHALKEDGRLAEAERVYRQALAIQPASAESHLHLGHVLKMQGLLEEAKTAYADALRRDPEYAPARSELIALGARGRIPHSAFGRDATTERLSRLSLALQNVEAALADVTTVSAFPVEAWDAFRRAHGTPPPPPSLPPGPALDVWIEARSFDPSGVRATLDSLLDQSVEDWRAVVLTGAATAEHPVASLSARDPRITFDEGPLRRSDRPLLILDAGTVLDPRALDWFGRAIAHTGADAVYADHDYHTRHWRSGSTYYDPALFSTPDSDDIQTTPVIPATIIVREDFQVDAAIAPAQRRQVLLKAARAGRAAHLPLLLSSIRQVTPSTDLACEPLTAQMASGQALPGSILVIVPTRDQAEMLQVCVQTLRATADHPENLDILILDNRSREPETRTLLDHFDSEGQASWRSIDEPFNWARLNNLAAAQSSAEILVFCNNDTECLSSGWDTRLRLNLGSQKVGVVGARLLYPDRTLQHAGVALGRNGGRPVHEGLHSLAGETGPLGRWIRRRKTGAVTGAFMALRRETFDELGGFDENLAIGYNDIDLCLKTRQAGLSVIYDPAITLIHHESKTRGYNHDEARIRWDDGELDRLHERWGGTLLVDPSINPRWVSAEARVFDGFRDVSARQAVAWLDGSAGCNRWRIGGDEAGDAL